MQIQDPKPTDSATLTDTWPSNPHFNNPLHPSGDSDARSSLRPTGLEPDEPEVMLRNQVNKVSKEMSELKMQISYLKG